ncbi:MAG: tyrosine--tRNA ligase [Gemmatimonadota bacterium]|nr:MAG: tyrosine--tRNA ligase [Gemmatimonadota bacterium]
MKSVEEQFKVLMRGVDYGDDVTKRNMEEELRDRLKADRPLKVYLGVDPTSPDLHLGHIVPIQKLKQFQDLGHEITFLIGDFTGRVGDPSGQSKTRPMLTDEELKVNAKTYTDQVFRILDERRTRVEFNSTWLSKLTFEDVIKLASSFTVAQFLERDYFRRRFDKGEAIHLQEFLYCLMQGYDAIQLETDVQIGGVDQLFNLLIGRELQRAVGQKPQIAITLPLLVGTDGTMKMSKSYGNAIGLWEQPGEMYGKVMSIPDHIMINYFTLLTDMPLEEIEAIEKDLGSEKLHPRDAKMRLAREIVAKFQGEDKVAEAEEAFVSVFQKRELPEDMPQVAVPREWVEGGVNVIELVMETNQVPSTSEARRLIQQGGLKIDGEKVASIDETVKPSDGTVIRMGKRRFAQVRVKE